MLDSQISAVIFSLTIDAAQLIHSLVSEILPQPFTNWKASVEIPSVLHTHQLARIMSTLYYRTKATPVPDPVLLEQLILKCIIAKHWYRRSIWVYDRRSVWFSPWNAQNYETDSMLWGRLLAISGALLVQEQVNENLRLVNSIGNSIYLLTIISLLYRKHADVFSSIKQSAYREFRLPMSLNAIQCGFNKKLNTFK